MEDFRTLYCDPGEDTGWALGKGLRLLAGGTEKMWTFADDVWAALQDNVGFLAEGDTPYLRDGVTAEDNSGPIGRIVMEDFRIYPWAARELAWDQVRTARLIGALTFMARVHDIPVVLQPAAIKKRAQAGGAEEMYYTPLHENRHANDAIQHFTFFTQTELLGNDTPMPGEYVPEHHPV
jgi:hypothetical protein